MQISRAMNVAVRAHLDRKAVAMGVSRQMFFVALAEKYRNRDHPVLGPVDPDEVTGLRAYNQQSASEYARHWLGLRGFIELMTLAEFSHQQDELGKYPHGCPHVFDVPAARHWVHPQGGRITIWANGDMDCFHADGRRKQTTATPEKLEEGHGAWQETWFDYDGTELTRPQIAAICIAAGAF